MATVTRTHSAKEIMSRPVWQYWKHPLEISTGPSQQPDNCSGSVLNAVCRKGACWAGHVSRTALMGNVSGVALPCSVLAYSLEGSRMLMLYVVAWRKWGASRTEGKPEQMCRVEARRIDLETKVITELWRWRD
jgi:hypothetical protein